MCRDVPAHERRDGESGIDEEVRGSMFKVWDSIVNFELRTLELEVIMKQGAALIGGAELGAGVMYLLDPDRGKRRRALVRDQAVRSVRKTRDAVDATAAVVWRS